MVGRIALLNKCKAEEIHPARNLPKNLNVVVIDLNKFELWS
jgi:hypothetical protein